MFVTPLGIAMSCTDQANGVKHMEYRIIKSPSRGTLEILARRKGSGNAVKLEDVDAVGLVQGRLIEMVCAADVAEKAVGVTVEDIRGSCPQHMIMLAIFGDTASVEAALEEIRRREKEGAEEW